MVIAFKRGAGREAEGWASVAAINRRPSRKWRPEQCNGRATARLAASPLISGFGGL